MDQLWNVPWHGTRIFLGISRCASQILIYNNTPHNFCSRCGTKGTVSVLCGPRKASVAHCRASRNECRQMVCSTGVVIILTQPILQSLVGHVLFHGLRLWKRPYPVKSSSARGSHQICQQCWWPVRNSPPEADISELGICRVYTNLANFYSVQTKLFISHSRLSCFAFCS